MLFHRTQGIRAAVLAVLAVPAGLKSGFLVPVEPTATIKLSGITL